MQKPDLSLADVPHAPNRNGGVLAYFWTRPLFWLLVLLVVSLPFWVSAIPPLMDLPGHMARYHIMRELPTSPALQRYYEFHWGLMGNLGVDLIVYGLKDILDVERATWAVTLTTALLTALAIPVLSKTVHGSVQPTALMALPFVYAHFFHFGFLNYALSVALALLSLALWLKLATAPARWRLPLFVGISLGLWLCHSMGWGIFAVCTGMIELQRAVVTHGMKPLPVLRQTTLRVLPAAVPLVLMVLWRSDTGMVDTTLYQDDFVQYKLAGFMTALRETSPLLDIGTLALMILTVFWALREKQARTEPALLWAGLGLLATYAVMPSVVMTSAYADTRLMHVVLILLILSLRWQGSNRPLLHVFAMLFLGLFGLRMAFTTRAWADANQSMHSHLMALRDIPDGSRILSFMLNKCDENDWPIRYEYNHLTDMGVVRKNAFVNSQWAVPGAQLLRITYNADTRYQTDPSQYVFTGKCADKHKPPLAEALRSFPRDRFDYVWITRTQGHVIAPTQDLQLLRRDGNAMFFKIIKPDLARTPKR